MRAVEQDTTPQACICFGVVWCGVVGPYCGTVCCAVEGGSKFCVRG